MQNFTLKALAAGAAFSLLASPAHAQLDSALSAAKASTAASAAAQERIEQLDDQAESAAIEYRAVLQEADNVRLSVDRQEIFLESQRSELASVRRQLRTVDSIKQSIVPMMLNMVVQLEDHVAEDLPFRLSERRERIEDVKRVISDPDVSPAEQYRRILNAYEIETNYGYQVDAYEGQHPTRPGNVVDFVRFGRTSWVYMTKDQGEVATYDLASGEWRQLDGGEAARMRQAIRVANEEAAPEVVYAPVIKR